MKFKIDATTSFSDITQCGLICGDTEYSLTPLEAIFYPAKSAEEDEEAEERKLNPGLFGASLNAWNPRSYDDPGVLHIKYSIDALAEVTDDHCDDSPHAATSSLTADIELTFCEYGIDIEFDAEIIDEGEEVIINEGSDEEYTEVKIRKYLEVEDSGFVYISCWGCGNVPWNGDATIAFTLPEGIEARMNGITIQSGASYKFSVLGMYSDGTMEIIPHTPGYDMKIMAVATPDSRGGSFGPREAEEELTAYRINVDVMEKPWGGEWDGPGSQGEYGNPIKKWFHLWEMNENAIRAYAEPGILNVKSGGSFFSGIAASSFTDEADSPDCLAQPQWKEIVSEIGTYLDCTATVQVNGADLEGKRTKFDVAKNDIQSIEWIPIDNDTNAIRLASHGEGYRCFPEKTSPKDSTFNNKINIMIRLAIETPEGMQGRIGANWFDPDNPIGSQKSTTKNGKGIRDNNGDFDIDKKFIDFLPKELMKIITGTFKTSCAGDNYIIVAYSPAADINKITFKSDGVTLERPESKQNKVTLEDKYQTHMLTVWRTLWIERKRMSAPTEGTGTNQFDPRKKYTPGAEGDRGDIRKNEWMDGSISTTPIDEPHNFDVKFQPLLPDIDLVVSELVPCCIDVKNVTNELICYWTGKNAPTLPAFKKHLDYNSVTYNSDVGRDIPKTLNTKHFWILHTLGAFNPKKVDSYDTAIYFPLGVAADYSAIIYNENLRDVISTYRTDSGAKPQWIPLSKAHQTLVLHEIMHYFLGKHGDGSGTAISDQGVMYKSFNGIDNYLYVGGTNQLNEAQCHKIQSCEYPKNN